MSSIHVDVGMQCVDCHFSQDNHGNGYIYGEVAAAVEIDCKDCHGTALQLPNLYTSGPAALGWRCRHGARCARQMAAAASSGSATRCISAR